ncbi:hypothetical protein HMI54_013153, partial [Coelomomyces lativittatus]
PERGTTFEWNGSRTQSHPPSTGGNATRRRPPPPPLLYASEFLGYLSSPSSWTRGSLSTSSPRSVTGSTLKKVLLRRGALHVHEFNALHLVTADIPRWMHQRLSQLGDGVGILYIEIDRASYPTGKEKEKEKEEERGGKVKKPEDTFRRRLHSSSSHQVSVGHH